MEEKSIRWRKTGGGPFLAYINGKKKWIKPGQIFDAKPSEIPQGFRDTVIPVDKNVIEVVEKKAVAEALNARQPEYNAIHRGAGWYNVVDEDGKIINEKALKKEDAYELIAQLKGG